MVLSAKSRDLLSKDSYPRRITDDNPYASDKSRRHLYGHHHTQFENETFNGLSPRSNLGERFNKKQHFVHGKPPCGSSSNILAYGGIPNTAPKRDSRRTNLMESTRSLNEMTLYGSENSTGFLYGMHDTEVGQSRKINRKDALPPWMKDKTSAELRKREIQSKEKEEDLVRSRLERANERANKLAEQRKDYEMLQNYKPWGRPGGGAPRGIESDRSSTVRTRHVGQLTEDYNQVLPLGKPGAGAPNRTESGKIKTKLAADSQIRLRAHRDGRPIDSIPLKNASTADYKTELDKMAEETRYRRHMEKEHDFEMDLQTLKYNPFGRPGAGAPLRGNDGSPRAGLPLHLSNNIYELRSTEPKHGHMYSGLENNENSVLPMQEVHKSAVHEVVKKQDPYDEVNQGFQFGMPGGGAPIRDKNGRVITHGRQTLVKDRSGAIVKSPTKAGEAYFPFGRPGAGAPIRDEHGNLRAHVTGVVESEQAGKIKLNADSVEARKMYLETLRKMEEEQKMQRTREKEELRERGAPVAQWLERGMVGRPKYDPVTREIRAGPMMTSDVTRQRMNINPQASEKSRIYHHDLDEMMRERAEQQKKASEEQRERSVEHAKTMERTWGRPGHGAPNAETKKAKFEMIPADQGRTWRDD